MILEMLLKIMEKNYPTIKMNKLLIVQHGLILNAFAKWKKTDLKYKYLTILFVELNQ